MAMKSYLRLQACLMSKNLVYLYSHIIQHKTTTKTKDISQKMLYSKKRHKQNVL